MRHIALISIIFALSVTLAEAQRGFLGSAYSPGIHPVLITDMEGLDLTEDQKTELAELMVNMRSFDRGSISNQRPARGNRGNFRTNRKNGFNPMGREQRIEQRSEFHNKVMEILTDEQKNMLNQRMIERIESAHEFRMLQHEVMLDKAGLEAEKKTRVLALLEEHHNEMLAARKEALSSSGFAIGFRGVNAEKRIEMQDRIKEILTAAEFEQLQEVMGMRPYSLQGNRRGMRPRNR